MSKAGNKILAGAREALAIVKGDALPARVTSFGWMHWHPIHGFDYGTLNKYGDVELDERSIADGWVNVTVKIEARFSNGES